MTKHLSVNVTCRTTKTRVFWDMAPYRLTICMVAREYAASMSRVDIPRY